MVLFSEMIIALSGNLATMLGALGSVGATAVVSILPEFKDAIVELIGSTLKAIGLAMPL